LVFLSVFLFPNLFYFDSIITINVPWI
jgi:hypothetical protein